MIDLVKSGPTVAIWQHAEECLYTLAGELAPAFEVGEGKVEDRQRLSEQWAAWWKARGGQILLGQKDDGPADVAVLAETTGRVWEWQPDAKPRFEITGLTSPVDARVLPGHRVLVAEEGGLKVSEYSFKGKLLWEKSFEDGPVSVQRLPNGNTFVATYSRFVEVRRDGSVASTIDVTNYGRISDANKLRDGRIVCLFNNNQLVFFSPEGKEQVKAQMEGWGGVDSLPNGHVLVSQIHVNKIVEVDGTGKVVWEFAHPALGSAPACPTAIRWWPASSCKKCLRSMPRGRFSGKRTSTAIPTPCTGGKGFS